MNSQPTVLGLKKSFGFGDRLGLAGEGHIAALGSSGFLPILAQQSIRELTRTERTPTEVLDAARRAVQSTGYAGPWGADADHLKTPADAERLVAAGYTFFTIDPSEHVNNEADKLDEAALREVVAREAREVLERQGVSAPALREYAGKSFETDAGTYRFSDEALLRAAVKYGRALAHCEVMARRIGAAAAGRPFEIEVSIDETESTTSPLDHLYVALELRRRGVNPVSVAPRFVGGFEKGIDYKGDLAAFENDLRGHAAIARAFGPYKISIHSGSDKFSIYPIIGRLCGDLLHVKTAGTSYLEALRVVCRGDTALFAEICRYCLGRFPEDKASYHISVSDAQAAAMPVNGNARELERVFLDEDAGRQVLHVTFGSVLAKGRTQAGRPFKQAITEILAAHPDLHREVLVQHLGRHIKALEQG